MDVSDDEEKANPYKPPAEPNAADKFRAWKESRLHPKPNKIRVAIAYVCLGLLLVSIPLIGFAMLMAWAFWSISQGGWLD